MVIRELIALFGIDIDAKSIKKIDAQVSKVEGKVKKVGKTTETALGKFEKGIQNVGKLVAGSIFLAGFARAAGAVVGFASDAEETLNLVRETFGNNASEVEAWSVTVAREIGRSEFLMREMAGSLGAVLTPMMEGNTEASAKMATGLAELAVDLGSFFNAAESDVLIALRAGIVGEAEPMRRFGVVMLESTLQTFALSQGITKTVKSMSIAEKTTLRYNFILSQTVTAQGDAARTSEDFANASRAAADGIKDLATRIGTRLLPVATRFVLWARDASRSLVEVVQKTHLLEAVLLTLAVAMGIAAVMMLAPFVPFLITAAKVLVAIGLISLAVDELITFFSGGKTVIGEFIDELFGIGAAQEFLDNLNTGWSEMHGWWLKLIGLGDKLGGFLFDIFGDKKPDLSAPKTGGRRRAVTGAIDSDFVTSRKGSTGANLRLERAEQLAAKRRKGKKLNKREKLELSRITDEGGIFREESGEEQEVRRGRRTVSGSSSRAARRRRRALGVAGSDRSEARRERDRRKADATEQGRLRDVSEGASEFARTPARGAPPQAPSGNTINAQITITEANNPAAVERAVQRGIAAAVSDAGASTARGVR